ncbi:carboxypeptidase-like regulatory domain-containing protein [Patescibacteria group bacterium]
MRALFRFISSLILLVIVLGGGYYFFKTYYPEADSIEADLIEAVKSVPALVKQTDDSDLVPLDSSLNTNLDSQIALVATAENGEGLAAVTKIQNNTEVLDKVVIKTKDNETGVIEMGSNGLPAQFLFKGQVVSYSNYTDDTVDITVSSPAGAGQVHKASPLNLPSQKVSSLFIKTAQAAGPDIFLPTTGVTRKDYVESDGDDAGFFDYITSSAGTAINIVTCGISIPAAIGTAGASSPFSYLACGALLTRLVTHHGEIGPCQGDIIDCATNAILSSLRNKGPVIAGQVMDLVTKKPINRAVLTIRDKTGKLKGKAYSNAKGYYRLPLLDIGGYSIVASAKDQTSKTFLLATTGTRIQISDDSGNKPVNQEYNLSNRQYFKKIPGYYGPELNQHHNIRFDIEFGEGGFDGAWTGRAETVVASVPDPDYPGEVIECGGADFKWVIKGDEIKGSAQTDMGYPLTLTGEVDDQGKLKAGVAFGTMNVASFDGNLIEDKGKGTWSDPYGCHGGFTVTKDGTSIIPEGQTQMQF